MPRPRKTQVSVQDTPFYHCTVRCVRRAYLCGEDHKTGRNYDHRKQWLVSRLRFLSYIFSIDIVAYAVMSNHYHVILHVDEKRAEGWSDEEVVERWMQLFNGHVLIDRWLRGEIKNEADHGSVKELIQVWRERLSDLSWFMRCTNETIAKMSNKEDQCTGRFWEGRFKSQALLDEVALLTCMAYVDLNPVRAKMADSPEASDFTSIQQRLYDYLNKERQKTSIDKKKSHTPQKNSQAQQQLKQRVLQQHTIAKKLGFEKLSQAPLMPFDGSSHTSIHDALPFTEQDYYMLVDTTGRMLRPDKRGAIKADIGPILNRLGINESEWLDQLKDFGKRYTFAVGRSTSIRDYANRFQKQWFKGIGVADQVYRKAA